VASNYNFGRKFFSFSMPFLKKKSKNKEVKMAQNGMKIGL